MNDVKSCEQCGAEHTKKRFCSAPCYYEWRKGKKLGGYKKIARPSCIVCGTECNRSTTKFCSPECYQTNRSIEAAKKEKPKCLHCGNECKTVNHVYCSLDCSNKRDRSDFNRKPGTKPRRNKRTAIKERPCKHCGIVFMPNNYKDEQKYCTRRCMGLARADDCAALGRAKKGTKLTLEQREKLSIIASNRNANQEYTKGKGGTREDVGHYVRSSWEANVARVLKHEGIEYNYEPKTFVLQKPDGSNTRYTPDFYALGHYLEVKGWWDHRSLEKKRLMAEQYPEVYIEYIDEPVYNELKKNYEEEVKWE